MPACGTMLADSVGVLQLPPLAGSARASRKPLKTPSPSSNSWLPDTKASKQMLFIICASALPLKKV